MRRNWTPSIVPNGHDQTVYIVPNDFGQLGRAAYCEASEDRSDLETTISDLISGQYDNPVRVMPRASLRSVLLICAFSTACICRVSTQTTGKPASASPLR
jgi:hypothetical protein